MSRVYAQGLQSVNLREHPKRIAPPLVFPVGLFALLAQNIRADFLFAFSYVYRCQEYT